VSTTKNPAAVALGRLSAAKRTPEEQARRAHLRWGTQPTGRCACGCNLTMARAQKRHPKLSGMAGRLAVIQARIEALSPYSDEYAELTLELETIKAHIAMARAMRRHGEWRRRSDQLESAGSDVGCDGPRG
jgi:hypothetical protein